MGAGLGHGKLGGEHIELLRVDGAHLRRTKRANYNRDPLPDQEKRVRFRVSFETNYFGAIWHPRGEAGRARRVHGCSASTWLLQVNHVRQSGKGDMPPTDGIPSPVSTT